MARLASGMQVSQSVCKSSAGSQATNAKYSHSIASLTGEGRGHVFNSPPLPLANPSFQLPNQSLEHSSSNLTSHHLPSRFSTQSLHALSHHQQQLHELHSQLHHGFGGANITNNSSYQSLYDYKNVSESNLRQSSPETTPSEKLSENGSDGTGVDERDENRPLHQLSGTKSGNNSHKSLKTCSSKKPSRGNKGARLCINARERRRMHDLNDALDNDRIV